MPKQRKMFCGVRVDCEQKLTEDGSYAVPVDYVEVSTEVTAWRMNKEKIWKACRNLMKTTKQYKMPMPGKANEDMSKAGQYPRFAIVTKYFIEPDKEPTSKLTTEKLNKAYKILHG